MKLDDIPQDHLIYLASPYTHEDKLVMYNRFKEAEYVVASLLKENYCVYSPIVHCHSIAQKYKLPTDFAYWAKYDEAVLKRCTHMYVLELEGWMESNGIKFEKEVALKHNIPIRYLKVW